VSRKHETIDSIRSVAKTLGAVKVCGAAFELGKTGSVQSVLVTDEEAVDAVALLRACPESGGVLVEPACGASLAILQKKGVFLDSDKIVVVIVCGGNAISDDLLDYYRKNCFVPTVQSQ
jgi:L-serine/L-threonine ammonia-lyase